MSAFTPDWKLTVGGVDYTDIAISDIQHEAGRTDIYQQPSPSYCTTVVKDPVAPTSTVTSVTSPPNKTT